MIYSHRKIEQKWQAKWYKNKLFTTDLHNLEKPKLYLLDMFPYPSGKGLHVGHLRGYLATDILTRMKMMQGFNVLHPIGFDSFGLPAEQYAIRTKKPPAIFTEQNIAYFTSQLKNFGFAYDFENIIKTHDPKYYHWTQWTFLQLWKKNLVYQKTVEVNYCPNLGTVLANEEIINLKNKMVSERGEHPVVRQEQKQWMIKITAYANYLLQGLKKLDWSEAIKKAQVNWIGKTDGFTVHFTVSDFPSLKLPVSVFDLIHLEATVFFLIQINNKLLDSILSFAVLQKLQKYRQEYSKKPIVSRGKFDKKATGLFSGLSVINPINSKKIPIFFVEYITSDFAYATKLGVPAIDIQDWFFAQNQQILNIKELNLAKKGILHKNVFCKVQLIKKKLQAEKILQKTVFYKLRDWIFARQRYWGEPFPIFYQKNQIHLLDESKLPLVLPPISSLAFLNQKTSTPLSRIEDWVNSGYDVNVMPQWAGSCWYFLAYLLKKSDATFWPLNSIQAKTILNRWMPVDIYVGGQEHAVSHLLYARFWNAFLVDIGCYDFKEPFQKLKNPGLILASDGKKMSKSKGNIIDPNSFLISHGADALRLYEKFLGPFEQPVIWNERGLDAMRKWLARVYSLFVKNQHFFQKTATPHLSYVYAQTVKSVTLNYEKFNFNIAISQLMVFINACYKSKLINWDYGIGFLKLLYPICPHLTEEIWSLWHQKTFLAQNSWPTYQEEDLKKPSVDVALQINGKTKKIITLPINLEKQKTILLCQKKLQPQLKQQKIKKIIFVANKVVNFVI